MLQHLAGASIQVANLINVNCHPQEDSDNKKDPQKKHREKNNGGLKHV